MKDTVMTAAPPAMPTCWRRPGAAAADVAMIGDCCLLRLMIIFGWILIRSSEYDENERGWKIMTTISRRPSEPSKRFADSMRSTIDTAELLSIVFHGGGVRGVLSDFRLAAFLFGSDVFMVCCVCCVRKPTWNHVGAAASGIWRHRSLAKSFSHSCSTLFLFDFGQKSVE